MSDQAVLHVKGRILVGPDEVRDELWVVGGRISNLRPAGAHARRSRLWWGQP
ncbi:amidohydrolase, partial [Streptomyces sp. NPDC058964]